MAVQSTLVSTILNRMKRWQTISSIEDQFLVRDLDGSIRKLRRKIQFPWTLQKGSLRVFDEVLEYPVPADYDELAYLDTQKSQSFYPARARFKFTSLQQFFENPDFRNDIAEIRDANDVFLGVRYRPRTTASQLLNNAETESEFSVSGDATSVTKDTVVFKEGNASMRIAITLSASTATVKNTFSSFTDANYKQKFHFKLVYLDGVPTSISLRFQVSDSVYIETTGITTQFSGQPFKADSFNLVAHDLNLATEVGSISTSSLWASEKIILIGAATGTYYVDASHLRQWELLDFWFYSRFNIILVGGTTADQEYIMNASEVFSSDSKLIGDSEWIDVVMYDALEKSFADEKDSETLKEIKGLGGDAMSDLMENYPSMKPLITTQRYRLRTEYNDDANFGDVN